MPYLTQESLRGMRRGLTAKGGSLCSVPTSHSTSNEAWAEREGKRDQGLSAQETTGLWGTKRHPS
jgi:hypothetical protein